MRLNGIALAIGLLVATEATAASDWWWTGNGGKSPDSYNRYVDKSTIQKAGRNIRRAWDFVHTERTLPSGERSSRTLQAYDCKKRSIQPLARTVYDERGNVISTGNLSSSFQPAVPGSIGEGLLEVVCGERAGERIWVEDPRAHSETLFRATVQTEPPGDKASQPAWSSGTGFFVSSQGDVVTSHHVVAGAKKIAVVLPSGRAHPATVTRTSAATDLAVLKIDARTPSFLTLAAANAAKPGDKVFTFGFPLMEILGSEPKFTDGAISSLSGVANEAAFAQVSVPVQPGNSGGPLINEKGQVVGVIAAVAAVQPFLEAAGTLPQNVNWAVRGEYVAPLIKAETRPATRTRDEVLALARESVALIVVER